MEIPTTGTTRLREHLNGAIEKHPDSAPDRRALLADRDGVPRTSARSFANNGGWPPQPLDLLDDIKGGRRRRAHWRRRDAIEDRVLRLRHFKYR